MNSLAAVHSSRKSVVLRAMAQRGTLPEPVARLLYLLGTFRDAERVNPSQMWLARKLECTQEWVRRITRRAEAMGLLEVEIRAGRRTRRYRVRWGRLEDLAGDLWTRAVSLVGRALGGTKSESWGIVKPRPSRSSVSEIKSEERRETAPPPDAGSRPAPRKRIRPKGEYLIPEVAEKAAPKPRAKKPPKRPGFDAWRLYFCERWSGKFNGSKYPWQWGRDSMQMARIYDALCGNFDRFKGLVVHYLLIDSTSSGARWSATRGFDVTAMACRIAELIAA